MDWFEKCHNLCINVWEDVLRESNRDKIRVEADLRCYLFHKLIMKNKFKKGEWKINADWRTPKGKKIDLVFRDKYGVFVAWELKWETGKGKKFNGIENDISKLREYIKRNSRTPRQLKPLALLGVVGAARKIDDVQKRIKGTDIQLLSYPVDKLSVV